MCVCLCVVIFFHLSCVHCANYVTEIKGCEVVVLHKARNNSESSRQNRTSETHKELYILLLCLPAFVIIQHFFFLSSSIVLVNMRRSFVSTKLFTHISTPFIIIIVIIFCLIYLLVRNTVYTFVF